MSGPLRFIAFYLPQYHPIPENDAWWGRGFTEWTKVSQSVPLFREHRQPRVPADLGFYDLRVAESRQQQADLAESHGIAGFCYYHYWFRGRRLLERPFSEVLQSGEPCFPFCLCWANETWSRRWLGEESHVLMAQEYSEADDIAHARYLAPVFSDPRYIRIGDRPLFLIYRPTHLPDPAKTCETVRSECARLGVPEPYLVGTNAHCALQACTSIGFDHTLDFRPQLGALPHAFTGPLSPRRALRNWRKGILNPTLKVYNYDEANAWMHERASRIPKIASAFVGWDSTPRRGKRGIIIRDSCPASFGLQLEQAIAESAPLPDGSKLVFINAWNEWAEGNYLEPDTVNGLGYLEAMRAVVGRER